TDPLPGDLWLRDGRNVSALIDHHGAGELDDDAAILLVARSLYLHNAHAGARSGIALFQDLTAGINRVAFEERVGQANLVPAQVGLRILRDVHHRLAGDQSQGEG